MRKRREGWQRIPIRFALDDPSKCLRRSAPLEGAHAGQHFVEHYSEGPHVGVPIDRATHGLFRRHVRGRAEDDACMCPVQAHGRRIHLVDS